MATRRMISKSLSTSQKRARLHELVPELAEFCQALYPMLVVHADDFGRMAADAFTIKHAIEPTSPRSIAEFERGLWALWSVGLITCYEAHGSKYLEIHHFEKYQEGLHRRTKSRFPPIPGNSRNPPESAPRTGTGTGTGTELDQEQDLSKNEDLAIVEISSHTGAVRARDLEHTPAVNGTALMKPTWTSEQQNGHRKTTNLVNGADQRRHGQHAWCSERDGFCIPWAFHKEMLGKTQWTEDRLKAWYASTMLKFEGQAIGDDLFPFWRNLLAAELGTVTHAPVPVRHGKGNTTAAAALRVDARRAAQGKR